MMLLCYAIVTAVVHMLIHLFLLQAYALERLSPTRGLQRLLQWYLRYNQAPPCC